MHGPKLLSDSLHQIIYLEAFNNHNLTLPARLPSMKPHALNNFQTPNKAKLIPSDPKIALIPYLYSGASFLFKLAHQKMIPIPSDPKIIE